MLSLLTRSARGIALVLAAAVLLAVASGVAAAALLHGSDRTEHEALLEKPFTWSEDEPARAGALLAVVLVVGLMLLLVYAYAYAAVADDRPGTRRGAGTA